MRPLLELSIDTTREAVDWVCSLVGVDDPGIGRPSDPAWELSVVTHLPIAGGTGALTRIDEALGPLRRMGLVGEMHVDEVDAPTTLPAVEARRIGEHFVLVPPGSLAPILRSDRPLVIGPGPAFGSGLHPATVCSLRLIERHVVAGVDALDFGSGSGVLSVALARLGARVLAIDNDPVAVAATAAAVERNAVAAAVTVRRASLGAGAEVGHWMGLTPLEPAQSIAATSQFDVIVANVLARLHLTLADDYRVGLRRGGFLITAGYTAEQSFEVLERFGAAGLPMVDQIDDGEYLACVHRRRA